MEPNGFLNFGTLYAPQTDDRVDHPRALCVRSLEQNALSLIRKVLAAWWQDPLGMSVQAVAVGGFFRHKWNMEITGDLRHAQPAVDSE